MSANNMPLRQELRLELYPEENKSQKECVEKVREALREALHKIELAQKDAELSIGYELRIAELQERLELDLKLL